MEKSVFSVFDTKAQVFATPFFSHNHLTAIRDFANAAADPASQLSKNTADFILYEIARYNDVTGLIEPLIPIISHGVAQVVKTTLQEVGSL